MQQQRRQNTAPEVQLRKLLHARGLRYRVGLPVPGTPRRTIDIAFTKPRIAVFVDGCFWHRCPEHYVPPRNNAQWWERKIAVNVERDRTTTRALEAQGWTVIRVWEHEPSQTASERVLAAVAHARA